MTDANAACIAVFLRAPELGRVKTRLARHLDAAIVLRLYRSMVQDLLATVREREGDVCLFFTPDAAGRELRAWLGDDYGYQAQGPGDIGQRMARAFAHLFASGRPRVLLVGSDLPDLPAAVLAEAETALQHTGAVLGPAADGGYYLIGFRADRFRPEIFDDVAWSTARVLAQTLDRFDRRGMPVALLPEWFDIDTRSDLMALAERCRRDPAAAPRTAASLRAAGLMAGD